ELDANLRSRALDPRARQPAVGGVDVQGSLVERRARAEREQFELVGAVCDEENAGAHLLAVDLRAEPVRLADDAPQRPRAVERLAAPAMMLTPVHESCVETERDVVQEEPVVHAADVDPAPAAVERVTGADRIVPVEAEVAGEVVPRPERDADE